jgi:hypothetical protein
MAFKHLTPGAAMSFADDQKIFTASDVLRFLHQDEIRQDEMRRFGRFGGSIHAVVKILSSR